MFNRDTIEAKLDKYQELLIGNADPTVVNETMPQSWIQIKAAAMQAGKKTGGPKSTASKTSKKSMLSRKSKVAVAS